MGRLFEQDGKLINHKVYDPNPALDTAAELRSRGQVKSLAMSDAYHVARIPQALFYQWLREAGVSPSDHEAAEEVLWRNLMSPEYAHFRVWEGKV